MDGKIGYRNTDLVLTSAEDLTALAAVFETWGAFVLHLSHGDDGLWYAAFEAENSWQLDQPEAAIAAMIVVAESLQEPLRSIWLRCTRREFDIGYDCGVEPWAFNQGLSSGLLGRIAAVGASLRITLYPDREPHAEPGVAPDGGGQGGTP